MTPNHSPAGTTSMQTSAGAAAVAAGSPPSVSGQSPTYATPAGMYVPTASDQPLLQVRDLRTHFPIRKGVLARTVGYVKAVDGVTFDVPPGKTLGLVGESGCGKTTVGRTILRLIPATSGSVTYRGQNFFA